MRDTRQGVKMRADGKFPLEIALTAAMASAEVRLHLQPLQGSAGSSGDSASGSKRKLEAEAGGNQGNDKQAKRIENLQNQIRNMQSGSSNKDKKGVRLQQLKGGGKAAGKKGGGKGPRMPQELIGMESSFNGEPICFAFNLAGCDKALPGAKCLHGWHVCAKPSCAKPDHGQRAHPVAVA